MVMKKRNKLNSILWLLVATGALSAGVRKTLVYNIAYDKAYDKAYKTTYQSVYDEAWSKALDHGIKERGYNPGLGPDYCTDFGLLDEVDTTAEKTATKAVETIASQKAQTAADYTHDLGISLFAFGLCGLVAKNNEK